MATVDQIARDALDAVGSPEALVSAHRWVNRRYAQLVAQVRFRHLRQAGQIVVPGVEQTGTCSITRGSTAVVGVGTAWDVSLRGRWLRPRVAWYEIAQVNSATSLTLATPFAEEDAVDAGVRIVQRYLELPADVRFVQSFTLLRLWQPLQLVSQRIFEESVAPGRPYVTSLGAGQGYLVDLGWSRDTDTRRFELWPYATTSETLGYVWWSGPREHAIDEELPPTIDRYVLVEGVLIDVFRWEAAQAMRRGDMNGAAFFRNESRAQETTWKRYMQEAARQDRGADDTTFLIASLSGRGAAHDIRNAHDQVWSRGQRP